MGIYTMNWGFTTEYMTFIRESWGINHNNDWFRFGFHP